MAQEKPAEKKVKVKRASPLKRDLQSTKRRASNRIFKATMRTTIRKFEETLEKGDETLSQNHLSEVYSILDKGVKFGILKKNKANRTKARTAARLEK